MSYDIIVIGGGIAGASLASELAASRRVLLLEKEDQPGYHATGRSAALFLPNYGEPEIAALTALSETFLRQPPADFTETPLVSDIGCLLIGLAGEESSLDDAQAESARNWRATERVDADRIAELLPVVRREAICGGLWDPTTATIDVNALHSGFLRRLRRHGGELALGAEALGFERANGVWRISALQRVFEAPIVVNAAGAWADAIGQMMGAAASGITPHRRTVALASLSDGVDPSEWPFVLHVKEEVYFKPETGKLLVSPGDETPSAACDAQADDLDVAVAIDRLEQLVSLSIRRVSHRWAGLRTFAPDRVPVVGFDPVVEGLFWLAGQGGGGIMTSPALARFASALLLGGRPAPEFERPDLAAARMSPKRLFSGQTSAPS